MTDEPELVYVRHTGLVQSQEGPEAGSRYRFTVQSCLAFAHNAGGELVHLDADWWGELRTVEVRAHDLAEAIEKLGQVPFRTWFEDDLSIGQTS